jgi:hypothetical protein
MNDDINRSDAYGYYTPPEEQEWNDAIYKRAHRLANKRPLPSDYSIDSYTDPMSGSAMVARSILVHNSNRFEPIGKVDWNRETGHVHWLGINEGHRHMLPHLMSAAKNFADSEGYAPPLSSSKMSDYSYKLAKKYAPEHIPDYAWADSMPVGQSNTVLEAKLAKMGEHINIIHSLALSSAPPENHAYLNEVAATAHRALRHAKELHAHYTQGAPNPKPSEFDAGTEKRWEATRRSISDSMDNLYKPINAQQMRDYDAFKVHSGVHPAVEEARKHF